MTTRTSVIRRSLIAGAAVLFLATLSGISGAYAVTIPANDQGVQISPTLISLSTDPGKPVTVSVSVMNVTNKTLQFTSAVNDFTSKDESGTPSINLNSTLPVTASMHTWVSAIAPFTLKPYESHTVTATITPPLNADAGGHYGVLRFSGSIPGATPGTVSLSASAGTLILMRVSGNILEQLNAASFTSTDASGNHHGIFESSPVTFLTRLENQGTIHLQPSGSINITDMFGRSVASLPVNPKSSYILPHSIRRFDETFSSGWLFGRYTANLTVPYGTTGGVVQRTIAFWVIPWKLIGGILLAIAIIVLGIRFWLRRHVKKAIERSRRH